MNPRIAVVTPYYREPRDMLWQCHRSVLDQGVGATHVMIADGFALAEIDGWDAHHVKLPTAHGDNGNTPRGLGALLAKAEGFDFIAWLDADNWYHAGHLASLLALHRHSSSAICSSFRTFHTLSGALLAITEADEDAARHIDTSCYLIHKSNFDLVGIWLDMPRIVAPICDRVFLDAILQRGRSIQSTGLRTVAFRTQYASHYRAAGLAVPAGAKDADFADAAWAYLRAQTSTRSG
jgi:glycosyltransferase involved in cell wall biosynthesis